MKPASKVLFITPLVVFSTLALGWIGGILYWQIRVGSALQSWEDTFDRLPSRLFQKGGEPEAEVLLNAGCRALPQMVRALNRSGNRVFQQRLMTQLLIILTLQNPVDDRMKVLADWEPRWSIRADNLELEQKYKVEDFNAWWETHHYEYHQGWRFWSACCSGN